MATVGAMFAAGTPYTAIRMLGRAVTNGSKLIRSKVAGATRPANAELQTVTARAGSERQPIHPTAFLRQSKRSTTRWSSTVDNVDAVLRRYFSSSPTVAGRRSSHIDRSKLPVSRTSRAVSQLPGRAPFASTLRPNLTGGALPRTAGGYAVPGSGRIGGARHFSHTPAAPAEVVQQVSQAVRAFWLSGQRARFDGVDATTGRPRYRAVGTEEDKMARALSAVPRPAPGSYVDFTLSPTITALSPLAAAFPFVAAAAASTTSCSAGPAPPTLNEDGFLDVLSGDFARALQDLTAVMADLQRLAQLGDLPVLLRDKNSVLRVRFPGVDAAALERLCDDVGVQRGRVGQDPDFDASVGAPVALRFPFAPGAEQAELAKTLTSPGGSMRSHRSELSSVDEDDDAFVQEFIEANPWLSSPSSDAEGYGSMSPPLPSAAERASEDFEGLEGIYRFLEECDRNKSRL